MPGEAIVTALIAAFGIAGLFVVLLIIAFLNPDKAQRWAEIGWALLSRFFRGANRQAVRFGVQSRLTAFSIEAASETGQAEPIDVRVEWAPADEKPNQFIADGRVVIRLHAHEHQDRNLMAASLLFISHTLVRRAKKYLPKRRARSIDLYATDRLLTRTAPAAADLLHEEVMGPECDVDHELGDLLVEYQRMDRVNTFFPVFVRELNYLAGKVVVRPRGDQLVRDVNELHRFLVRYSDRIVGQAMPLEVQGRFLRCAVVIIATTFKRQLGDRQPFVAHVQRVAAAGHETIYLIGSARRENAEFMKAVARDFRQHSGWTEVDQRRYRALLHRADGTDDTVQNLLIVLRTNRPRDYVGEAEEVPEMTDVPTIDAVDAENAT